MATTSDHERPCEGPSACAAPATSATSAEKVFEDDAIFHDDEKVLLGIGNEVQILERVAVDEEQVGERAFLDDADLPRVLVALAGHHEELAVGGGRHFEHLVRLEPATEL